MSAGTVLDRQINNYLVQLNAKQKKAVLTVVKTFVEEQEHQQYSPWEDAGFVRELERRSAELESGKIKGDTWEEVKQKARQSLKSRKKK